jgi:hypothetical protein
VNAEAVRAGVTLPAGPATRQPKVYLGQLDLIQQHAGPGQITSAARTAAKNAAVGGSKTSSHLTGQAFDFVPQDRNTARAAALANAGVPYDQIIDEGDHVHVGWGPKMRGQFMPRKGALPKAADLFRQVGEAYADVPKVAARRGNEGVAAMRRGVEDIADNGLGGLFGDPLETARGALQVAGGGLKAILAE